MAESLTKVVASSSDTVRCRTTSRGEEQIHWQKRRPTKIQLTCTSPDMIGLAQVTNTSTSVSVCVLKHGVRNSDVVKKGDIYL